MSEPIDGGGELSHERTHTGGGTQGEASEDPKESCRTRARNQLVDGAQRRTRALKKRSSCKNRTTHTRLFLSLSKRVPTC